MSSPTRKRQSNQSTPPFAAQSQSQSIDTASVRSNEVLPSDLQHVQSSPRHSLPPNPRKLFRIPDSPRSTPNEAHRTKAAKIAIPRLKKNTEALSSSARSSGRHRVNHACEPCRQRKTKCSGERPICKHCQDFRIDCFYADGKRDRAKKSAYPTTAEHINN